MKFKPTSLACVELFIFLGCVSHTVLRAFHTLFLVHTRTLYEVGAAITYHADEETEL